MIKNQNFLYSEGGGNSPFDTTGWDAFELKRRTMEVLSKLPQEIDLSVEAVVIDLFCGTGGTTWGFENVFVEGKQPVKVVFCVNHDKVAIASHLLNHPHAIHAIEDIRTLDLTILEAVVAHYRRIYPNAKVILWGSLECTNFSKAKGGLSRDPDSRTLANHLFRYIEAINPDYVMIENVVEFMAWGPVKIKVKKHHKEDIENGIYENTELKISKDKKTKLDCYWWEPISKLNGTYWMKWREKIKQYGYEDDWRRLNSADFGVPQTRDRLFGCFAKKGLPIIWPSATHSKNPQGDMFRNTHPWVGVKTVLDLENIGESIFNRDINPNLRKQNRKNLCPNTMKRYYDGCIKIIAGGKKEYEKYKVEFYKGGEKPFISQYYGNGGNTSIDHPNGTVPTKDRFAYFTQQQFVDEAFSGSTGKTIDQPSGSLLGIPKQYLLTLKPIIINTSYNNSGHSIDDPCPPILASRKHHYILNPSHGGHCTAIDRPSPVVIARQDKAPLYLFTAVKGNFRVPVYDSDCEWTVKIKEFMSVMGFSNFFMRMLEIPELLAIQSFPKEHKMTGSKSDQKKFIGNAVAPKVVTAMGVAYVHQWRELRRMVA